MVVYRIKQEPGTENWTTVTEEVHRELAQLVGTPDNKICGFKVSKERVKRMISAGKCIVGGGWRRC